MDEIWQIHLNPFYLESSFTGGAKGLQVTEWYGVNVLNLYFKNLKKKLRSISYFLFNPLLPESTLK